MHDIIPSGKDTCKPARSSDLSSGQRKDNCPNMRLRTCSKIRNKASIKKNTVIPYKTHSMKNICILSPLLGQPDTNSSGKDTGIPARYSDLCRGVSTDCNFLANKELQMQILHPTRENKVRPRHQARTPQKKADIQSRPMCMTNPAPRYHPMGGLGSGAWG